MRYLVPLIVLVGCGDMSSPLSIIDDLRVVDVRADPASPAVGETVNLEPLVFGAVGDVDEWVWWCSGDVCGTEPVQSGPFILTRVLVCEPGLCVDPPDLAEPDSWLVDLPFEGVSFAERRLPISPSPALRLNDNPTWLEPLVLPPSVAAGEEVELTVRATDDAEQVLTAFLFAGTGLVPLPSVELEEGEATLMWTAPESAGQVEVAVVVEDGAGGSLHVSGTVDVL